MGQPHRMALALLTVAMSLAACTARTQAMVPASPAPSLAEISEATIRGLPLTPGSITLKDGIWAGAPAPGGASGARAGLVQGFRITGDLDGDGADETAVLVWESGGGSGTFNSVAIFARRDGRIENIGTASLGDRVQVRAGRIEDHRLVLHVVRAGKADALCCPGELASRTWAMEAAGLRELPQKNLGRLSLAVLDGSAWRLRSWNIDEPVPAQPDISLNVTDGRLAGRSGCNSYSAASRPGPAPGDIMVGPVMGTRMACPEQVMIVEGRYLAQLSGVTKFGFLAGQLALSYDVDGQAGVMLFERSPSTAPVL